MQSQKCQEHENIAISLAEIRNDVKWIKRSIQSNRSIYTWLFSGIGISILTIIGYIVTKL